MQLPYEARNSIHWILLWRGFFSAAGDRDTCMCTRCKHNTTTLLCTERNSVHFMGARQRLTKRCTENTQKARANLSPKRYLVQTFHKKYCMYMFRKSFSTQPNWYQGYCSEALGNHVGSYLDNRTDHSSVQTSFPPKWDWHSQSNGRVPQETAILSVAIMQQARGGGQHVIHLATDHQYQ